MRKRFILLLSLGSMALAFMSAMFSVAFALDRANWVALTSYPPMWYEPILWGLSWIFAIAFIAVTAYLIYRIFKDCKNK